MLLSVLYVVFGTVLGVASQSSSCPEGWIIDLGNRRCYKFSYEPLEYVLAAQACAEYKATLVSIDSVGEQSFISERISLDSGDRYEWYTSGKRTLNFNQYIWEGTGSFIDTASTNWKQGYTLIPGERVILVYDSIENQYKWSIGNRLIKRAYICEIGQEEAYRVLIQKRDFTFGTDYATQEETPMGPTFEPDGTPENVWFLSTSVSLYLDCFAMGNPQPTYRWLRGPTQTTINEVVSTDNTRYTLTNGKLTIQDPVNGDSRYYRCEATNSQGTIVSNYAQLSMGTLGEFSNVQDAPVPAMEFEGAVIECSNIYYEPSLVYNWERTAGGRPEDIFIDTTPYIFISANGRLYFSEVTRQDETDYYCRVRLSGITEDKVVGRAHPPGAVSRAIKLQVRSQAAKDSWGPIIQDDFINVFPNPPVRGQNIRLECFAQGSSVNYKNNWSYNWLRKGGLPATVRYSDFNRVLIIPNAKAEDEGEYTCLVFRGTSSDSKSYTLKLNSKPYFLMQLKHQHIDIKSQFTWQCIADGNPAPTYSWYRNGTLIMPNDQNVRINNNILTIINADPLKHNGMYQCGASNIHGEILSSAQLRVLTLAPSFKKNPLPQSLMGAIGGNMTIECRPEAAPRAVKKWQKRSPGGAITDIGVTQITAGPMDPNAHFIQTLIGDLVINNIQFTDAGLYICVATNEYGEAMSVCNVTVARDISIISPPLIEDKVLQNETRTIRCIASYDRNLDLVYLWKFNGRLLDMYDEIEIYEQRKSSDYEQTDQGLRIKRVQYKHDGEYECIALTPVGSASAKGRLTVEGPPDAPSGLYVDTGRTTAYSMILYWTNSNDRGNPILEYEILYNVYSEPGEWYPATNRRIRDIDTQIQDLTNVPQEKRTYTLDNLLPWNNYTFKIRAKNILGWGVYSRISQGYTTRRAPPNINYNVINMNLTGGGGSVGDLTIKWNPLPRKYHGAEGLKYHLYWKRTTTDVWSSHLYVPKYSDEGKHQLYYTTLVGDKNYYLPYHVMIQPNNTMGPGLNSSIVTIYSAMGMPLVGTKLESCEAINSTAMRVYWEKISNDRETVKGVIGGFQVNYWPGITTKNQTGADGLPHYKRFIRFMNTGVVPESGVVIGLEWDSYTTFDVQVFNSAGLGPKSNAYPCETASWPTIHYPTHVQVHGIKSSGETMSVKVTWRGVTIETAEATIVGYKIYVWEASEDFREAKAYTAPFTPTEYNIELEKQNVFALRVAAYSQGGEGKKSPVVYFVTGIGTYQIDQGTTRFDFSRSSPTLSSSILLLLLLLIFIIIS